MTECSSEISCAFQILLPKFEQFKPGTRIVSHQFEIPGFPAESKTIVESHETGAKHTVYVWTLPLKK